MKTETGSALTRDIDYCRYAGALLRHAAARAVQFERLLRH